MLIFYPFKNNRFGISLGPSPSADDVDYKKSLPFGRSLIALGFIGVFLMVFGGIALSTLGNLTDSWAKVDELFDLVGVIFMVCWLLGWSIGVFALLIAFLAMLFGRGLLLIYQGMVVVHMGVPGFAVVIRQEASKITVIELVDPDPKSIFPKKGKQLLIGDGSSKDNSPVGCNMSHRDLTDVRFAISQNKHINAKLDPLEKGMKGSADSSLIDDTDEGLLELEAEMSGSVWVLILANLVPLIGAFAFGWELSEVMMLYWVETAVILLYQIIKHLVISPVLGIFRSLFSIATAGGFMAFHFLFIWELFIAESVDPGSVSGSDLTDVFNYLVLLWPAIVALLFSHGYSFCANFWPRRELYRSRRMEVKHVMERVILMHITLIFGGFLVFATGNNVVGVLLLIILKIGVDVTAHKKHHKPKLNNKDQNKVS